MQRRWKTSSAIFLVAIGVVLAASIARTSQQSAKEEVDVETLETTVVVNGLPVKVTATRQDGETQDEFAARFWSMVAAVQASKGRG